MNFKLPKKQIERALASFSKKEWLVFYTLAIVLVVSTLAILQTLNRSFMESVPRSGGEIAEGIVGAPRFVNPVLAYSDADRDLSILIYSGLMRKDAAGNLIPDLAEKYEVQPDGLTYTFTLKDNIYFHDGEPLTAEDVFFTVTKVKDSIIKSPRKGNWDGVQVEMVNSRTIKFSLRQSYASFLENTTLGILPEHLWSDSPMELNEHNTNPVGSGPYYIDKSSKQSSGVIDSYKLKPFKNFILGKPYINKITFRFYPNEEELVTALEEREVEQISSITPSNAAILKDEGYKVESSVLPRIFGLFFNQSQNQLFIDKNVVQAIDLGVDKDKIVRQVLAGYGIAIDDPIPPNMIEYQKLGAIADLSYEDKVIKAKEILAKDGWKEGVDGFLQKSVTEKGKTTVKVLEFSISTGNAPELAQTAELIKKDLGRIGMKVDIKTFDVGNLNQSVIRPRKYDALLFGQIINNESDLFAFWHSSQRNDPGLNVAMYTNVKVDKLLEDAFVTTDKALRVKKYVEFETEIKKDMPAVFIYSPNFIYVVTPKLKGLALDHIDFPGDRFRNIYQWYIETNDIWKIFSKN